MRPSLVAIVLLTTAARLDAHGKVISTPALPVNTAPTPAAPIWANEPSTFRDVPFGATEAEAKAKIPFIGCKNMDSSSGSDRMCTGYFSIGGATAMTNSFGFRDDKVNVVYLSFKSKDYDTVRAVLIEKYGAPSQSEHAPMKTVMNVELMNEKLVWQGKTVRFELDRYSGNVNDSSAIFITNETFERQLKERAARLKSDTDKF